MPKPIDQEQFWLDRINYALNEGELRHSVYMTNPNDWNRVDQQHREFCKKYIQPKDYILDAGCGFGRASTFLPGRYTGVDNIQRFIDLAKNNYPNKDFQFGDMTNLHFENDTFDWAVCIGIRNMIVSNLGQQKWDTIQRELLRVSCKGILNLEYGNNTGVTTNEAILK